MAESNDEEDQQRRARKNDMLKMYYSVQNEAKTDDGADVLNIDSGSFKPDEYMRKLKQEKNLEELMDTEHEMARQIRMLDSEMQTLVYENYNKFISATDTIRTMKRDFHKMEDEMEKLTTNVSSVAKLSSSINSTMHENRQRILKLSGVHSLLKKLQFLFELPARLKRCLEMGSYSAAVSYYTRTKSVLSHYQHMESFSGIQRDCTQIMDKVTEKLKDTFHNRNSTPQQLAECVGLLLQLGEPPASLCDDYLEHTKHKLQEDLQELELYITNDIMFMPGVSRSSTKSTIVGDDKTGAGEDEEGGNPFEVDETSPEGAAEPGRLLIDVLEFVDRGSNGFLSNLSLTIAAYENLFVNQSKIPSLSPVRTVSAGSMNEIQADMTRVASDKLSSFVNEQLHRYFALVEKRLTVERTSRDNALLVRALDRFYRRLQATRNLLPTEDVMTPCCDIVIKTAKARCEHYSVALQQYFADCITDARHILAAPKGKANNFNMLDLLNTTASSILNQIKSVLADVQLFTARDINFSSNPFFGKEFSCRWIREEIIINFIRHFCTVMKNFCEPPRSNSGPGGAHPTATPPALLLLLSRLSKDFELSTIAYVLTLTDEQFAIQDHDKDTLTADMTVEVGEVAQQLLECYVKQCGVSVSRMLRTSIESRDWATSVEPRQVRAVMRRVVEEIAQIDLQVGSLYEEGLRKAHSSDSSRRAFPNPAPASRQRERGGHWGNQSSNMDNSLMSNIQKLFSERVDVFGPVEFSRMSVLTGVVKIALKTLLECVRLRTFGKFGLQQLQVDCYYLEMYLWKFVSDENITHCLLDEVITSGIHRCIDPVRMEQSVIEVICERG